MYCIELPPTIQRYFFITSSYNIEIEYLVYSIYLINFFNSYSFFHTNAIPLSMYS